MDPAVKPREVGVVESQEKNSNSENSFDVVTKDDLSELPKKRSMMQRFKDYLSPSKTETPAETNDNTPRHGR